jgi:hypothetical protein
MMVECDSVPAPVSPVATDNCDPAPVIDYDQVRTDGACEDTYLLTRTWTARDRCGNESEQTRKLIVRDTTAPVLSGIPADATVECDSVPAPVTPSATDNCDPGPGIDFVETRIDGDCPGNYTLIREWTATDRCYNSSSESQVMTVVDTTPPEIQSGETNLYCLWPPDHEYVCFDATDFSPSITDNCSEPVTWEFVDCLSSQPDDGYGDGDTFDDCVVETDGQHFCVRAERSGLDPSGRKYAVTITATDACNNTSAPEVIGYIYVPHDQSPAVKHCIKSSKTGTKK